MIKNVYEQCPKFETANFHIRFVEMKDAADLLLCYFEPTDSVTTNAFGCDFGYNPTSLEGMKEAIRCWREAYKDSAFAGVLRTKPTK